MRALLLFSALLFGVIAVFAQLQPHSAAETDRLHRMVLDVDIGGESGSHLSGLRAEDLQLFDNETPIRFDHFQEITAATSDPSVEVILVLDAINTSHENLAHAEDQVRKFLAQDSGQLTRPTSILILSDTEPKLKNDPASKPDSSVMALQGKQAFVRKIPASHDGALLTRALNQSITSLSRILEAQGGEGESERVSLSLQALNFIATAERDQSGRKVVVWISPGWPLLAQSSAKTRDQLFDSIVYFDGLLRDARITLNMVDPSGTAAIQASAGPAPPVYVNGSISRGGPTPVPTVGTGPASYKNYLKPVSSARLADANNLALQVLADHTGGLVLTGNNQIAPQVALCAAQANAYYELSYDLPTPTGTAGYHQLDVKVTHPVSVKAARGYYAR